MRERLYIRLLSTDPDADTAYCIADAEARRSWAVSQAPLRDVLALAASRPVLVIVPADDVRLEALDLPVRQASKALQAARYALEDNLADDVEELHLALGTRLADGRLPVALVRHERMQAWLSLLQGAGIRPLALIPESLCLPPAENDRWQGLLEADRLLIRHREWGAFTGSREDLATLFEIADPERQQALKLRTVQGVDEDFSALGRPVELLSGYTSGFEALLQGLAELPVFNLLQGDYAPSSDYRKRLRRWRLPAALAAVWLVLAGTTAWLDARQIRAQATTQEARNLERFQQLFPSETRIVDLAVQAEQQLSRLQAGRRGDQVLELLTPFTEVLGNVQGLQVQGLQYREAALLVSLSGNSLQALETLRARFAERTDVRLEVQSANAGSEGVQIRLRVTRA